MINSQSLLRGPKKRVIHLESSKLCENTKSSHYRSSPFPLPSPPPLSSLIVRLLVFFPVFPLISSPQPQSQFQQQKELC